MHQYFILAKNYSPKLQMKMVILSIISLFLLVTRHVDNKAFSEFHECHVGKNIRGGMLPVLSGVRETSPKKSLEF